MHIFYSLSTLSFEAEFERNQDIATDHELTNRLIILSQIATTAKSLILKIDVDYKTTISISFRSNMGYN